MQPGIPIGRAARASATGPRRFARGLAAGAALLWGGVAWCAGPDSSAVELSRLPLEQLLDLRVSGASHFEQRISDAPSAVVVLTAADIRNYHWRTLADALASLPGLYVSYDRNYAYLGARGFLRSGDYDTRFLLLLNGNRLNDSVYDEATIGTEFILDPELIERIEYIPGPGSAVYGPNAFFGVINVVTRKGRDLRGAEGMIEGGSYGQRKARASYGWSGDGADALLSATVYDNPGRDRYYPEFDTPQQNHGVAHDLDYDRAQQYLLQLDYAGLSLTAAHSSRTKGIPTASFAQVFDDPRSQTVDAQTLLDLAWTRAVGRDLELSGHAFLNRYDYHGDYAYPASGGGTVDNRDGSHALWYGAGAHLVGSWFESHKLVLGADLLRDASQAQYNYDLEPLAVYLDDRRHATRYGVYGEDQVTLRPGLLLNLGLRYDHDDASGGHVNPRAALIWQALSASTVKLIYGTAFRAPNAYERYYRSPPPGGVSAGPDLHAERIGTYEVVLEQGLPDASLLTASLYHYDIHGLIAQSVDPASGQAYFANLERASASGAELSWQRRWSGGAELRSSYSWQLARDPGSGGTLQNSPRHLAKLNLSAPLCTERLRAGVEAQYSASQQGNTDRVSSYWVTNLNLLAPRLLPHLDASFTVYNLFDRRYALPGGDALAQNAIEQDRRTFLLRLGLGY